MPLRQRLGHRAHLCRQSFKSILTAGGKYESSDFSREGAGTFPADSGAGPGDYRDFSV